MLPLLLRHRYDVVHSMGRRDARASIRAKRVRRHRRTVITDLGLPSRTYWETVGPTEARAVADVARGIDVYSCMSKFALDFLGRDYDRHDGIVIPGGVELRQFVPAPARSPEPTLLFSAALGEARKGLPTLLAALPAVAAVEPGVRLLLSGPGDPAPFLAAAPGGARERVEVLDVGAADRQHERYGQAWVTCLPSVDDSFGMALIESLACGTPIVTSTQGAPAELGEDGVSAWRCEPGDADGLAAAVLKAIDAARQPSTVERCRAAAEPYDWRTGIAPYVEAVYEGRPPG